MLIDPVGRASRAAAAAVAIALIATSCGSSNVSGNGTTTTQRGSSASSLGAGGSGAGYTATTITIGFITYANVAQAGASGGFQKGADTGDTHAEANATVAYVNSHGGIAGRKVIPVLFDMQASLTSSPEAQSQAACTSLAEDHHVFAVVEASGEAITPNGLSCLANHHTPFISADMYPQTNGQAAMDKYATYSYSPNFPNPERSATAYIDGLAAYGFFNDPSAKFGLIGSSDPAWAFSENSTLKPKLAAHGVTLTKEMDINPNETGSAVLAMKSSGVDHLLFWGGAHTALFFINAAAAQDYYPRYGFSSIGCCWGLEQFVPTRALHAAISVGWAPALDVDRANDPGLPGETKCLSIMDQAGVVRSDRDADWTMSGYCDGTFFLQTALAGAQSLSVQVLATAVDHLGSGFSPAMAISSSFGPHRHDGASSYRQVTFNDGCSCFRYVGSPTAW